MSYRRDEAPQDRPKRSLFGWIRSRFLGHRDPHRRCRGATLTAAQDKAVARRALDEGDARHAAFHVACALFDNPNDREALDLADEILRVAPDPLALVPLVESSYAGTVALRAHFLAAGGQIGAAVKLVRQLVLVDRDKPFEFWALRWLERPEALAEVPPVDVAGILSMAIARFPGTMLPAEERPKLKPWLAVGDAFQAQHPEDALLLAMRALLYRRVGELERALQLADESYRRKPSYMAATARAAIHEAAGNLDAALAAYQDCLKIEPDDPEVRADMALLEMRRDNLEAAMALTQEGLRFKPDHRTLEPLSLFLRYRLRQDEPALEQLRQYAAAHPGHAAESWLGSLQPYIASLPPTAEATLNVVSQVLGELRKGKQMGGSVKLTVSGLEAPSCRMAAQRALARFGIDINTIVENVGKPDPRLPCKPVSCTLWSYHGTQPGPGLPAPPAAIAALVAEMAQQPYDLWRWAKRAAEAAREVGAADVPRLLAVTVHPPSAPEGMEEANWILRVQVAAALILAHSAGGSAEEALLSMLFGPMDWTNIAAVIALVQRALEAKNAAVSNRIAHLLIDRLRGTPRPGHCCFTYPTLWGLVALPQIDRGAHDEFVAMYNDYVKTSD